MWVGVLGGGKLLVSGTKVGVGHQSSQLPEPGWTTGFLVVKRKKGPE
ncbi:hypothetical protein [Bacillus sp. ISL-7]|nr:hypothetical protein [Bacillus sp. ISL-7]MBT2737917.1 hypothetical protein [Bacillus sp. ISL-7]